MLLPLGLRGWATSEERGADPQVYAPGIHVYISRSKLASSDGPASRPSLARLGHCPESIYTTR